MPLAIFYLTILHQNDIHSHFDFITYDGYPCLGPRDECFGGFSTAVHLVKDRIKNDKYSKNLLIVNSGDFFARNRYYSEFKWRLPADMIKHMPYTALALGDAEFIDGIEGLVPFLRAIGEKFVCTNIDFSGISNVTLRDELQRLCPRHLIIPYQNGKRHVCILGYTTPKTANLTFDSWIVFENEEKALTREIKSVRKNRSDVNIFVALGHSGYERDKQIAHRVPGLDVIVGGHSHTLLWPNIRNKLIAGVPADPRDKKSAKGVYPTVVIQPSGRTVLITQMHYHGKYFGVLNVTFNENDEVVDFYTGPLVLTGKMKSDADTEKSLDKYRQEMRRRQQQIIGSTRVELKGGEKTCYIGECSLGNFITDAVIWHIRHSATRAPRTLVAIIDAGAVTTNIMPGKFKMVDIIKSHPYPDTLDIVELRGSTIRKMLEHSLKDPIFRKTFLHFSGMRVRYNISKHQGQRVESVRILCQSCVSPRYETLNNSASYHVAMFTFITSGGHGLTMVKREMLSMQRRHDLSLDILINYVRQFSPLHPFVEGRIEIVGAPAVNNTAVSRRLWRGRWKAVAVALAGSIALPVGLFIL